MAWRIAQAWPLRNRWPSIGLSRTMLCCPVVRHQSRAFTKHIWHVQAQHEKDQPLGTLGPMKTDIVEKP
jgi:hypothetical protein